MYDRSKVGKGNRKIVRDHFRANGVEFEFGRNCVNNRYSFKPDTGFLQSYGHKIDYGLKAAQRQAADLRRIANTCPVPVTIHLTTQMNGYGYCKQYNTPVRFADV